MNPVEKLKELLESDTPRERIVRPSPDNKDLVQLLEKQSLALFEMTPKDMANIVIEALEAQVLTQIEIP